MLVYTLKWSVFILSTETERKKLSLLITKSWPRIRKLASKPLDTKFLKNKPVPPQENGRKRIGQKSR